MSDCRELTIHYQDDDFIVVEKPSGLLVHPWKECADTTSLLKELKLQTGKWIYPVHRLDRPVSGVILFAFSSEMAKTLSLALQEESTQKVYLALCKGVVRESKCVAYPLWNQAKTKKQDSKTCFWPLASNDWVTLTKIRIFTGRYHQIRRHFSAMAHQIICDSKYGKGKYNRFYRENYGLSRLFLHCAGLKISIPGKGEFEFISPLATDLNEVLQKIGLEYDPNTALFDDPTSELNTVNKEDIIKSMEQGAQPKLS